MSNKPTAIQRRRKLAELYVKGRDIRFSERGIDVDPPEDDDIVIWIQPPDPLQREQVLRDAQAARARAILAAKQEEDSNDAVSIRAFVAELPAEALLDYVVMIHETERQQEGQREVMGRDEWDDFTALQDAMRQWEESDDPEGPEWDALRKRDKEFGEQVKEVADRLRAAAYEVLETLPRKELERRAVDKRVDQVGSQAFMNTYERQMTFYACRDPEDHRELFFESSEELKSMPEKIQKAIGDTLSIYITDAREAKNSQRAAAGSQQSEPPDTPATSEVSTPEMPTE